MLKRQKKTTDAAQGADTVAKKARGPKQPRLYGVVAEFDNEQELVHAAEAANKAGFRRVDAYTPFPSEEVIEAIGFHHNRVSMVVLVCGLAGLTLGFLLQYYIMVIDYPLNFNGRDPFAWQAFVPAMFEMTILFAAFGAVFGMLALNGLPLPYHPIFNTPGFGRASRDGFFFCIEASDPAFEAAKVRQFMQDNRGRNITEVNQ